MLLEFFFDLAKAFDSLDHSILLSKSSSYGIRGQMLSWLQSYLSGRSQVTMINGVSSSPHVITYGVPQGSVLGPLLFLIYINDLGFIPGLNVKPKLFADDTNLFIHSDNIPDLKTKSQTAINTIYKWLLANKLNLNIDKTFYMIFSPSNSNVSIPNLDLQINNLSINKVSHCKFLGVIIDEKLSWVPHIEDLCLCLRRYVGIFYKLSFKLPPYVLKMLYFASIYPRILYGIEVYANTYLTYLHDLMILNNRLLRILQHRSRFTNTFDLYFSFRTLPVDKLFKYQLLIHAHEIFFKSVKIPALFHADRLVNSDIHNHYTRSSSDFHRISTNSIFTSRISSNLSSKFWNTLPSQIKSICGLPAFKKALKPFLYSDALSLFP